MPNKFYQTLVAFVLFTDEQIAVFWLAVAKWPVAVKVIKSLNERQCDIFLID